MYSPSPVRSIVLACHRLAANGFVAAFDGNVSARSGKNILVTVSGMNKGEITERDIVSVHPDGTPLLTVKGPMPTTELPMHLALYAGSPSVGGVVHAHPPFATAFAASGTPLTANVFPEVILGLGDVPLLPYAMPSTAAVGDQLLPFVLTSHGALLANHGAVTWGATVEEAYWMMEKLEHAAEVEWRARALGGVRQLSPDQVEELKRSHPSRR